MGNEGTLLTQLDQCHVIVYRMQRSLRVHFDLFAYDWTWNQSCLVAKACFLFVRIFHGSTRFRHRYRVACIGAGRQSSASEK